MGTIYNAMRTKRCRLIGLLVQANNGKPDVVGYRFLDEDTLEVLNVTTEDTYISLRNGKVGGGIVLSHGTGGGKQVKIKLPFLNVAVDTPILDFKLTDGKVNQLPLIDANTGQCIGNNKIIFRARVVSGNQTVGYLVTSYNGSYHFMNIQGLSGYTADDIYNAKKVRNKKVNVWDFKAVKGNMPTISLDNLQADGQYVRESWSK